jgi:hypothetical protein
MLPNFAFDVAVAMSSGKLPDETGWQPALPKFPETRSKNPRTTFAGDVLNWRLAYELFRHNRSARG